MEYSSGKKAKQENDQSSPSPNKFSLHLQQVVDFKDKSSPLRAIFEKMQEKQAP